MITQSFTVTSPTGLHVRPIKTFVEAAGKFPCKISVLSKGKKVNGKSSLSMLTLGVAAHDEVTLEIDGEGEQEAMKTLGEILLRIHE
ncbi:HPr family phosphocarrier protein [Cohnella nanjingensis]|uniref:HPr family phosphocarrier protein n=1 Tax=Cohnella nanjingensis TaxID=1387779 RepID=A0A7X0RQY4_9BACL|nr:HPr family phosphocarrier protein [Cohnella nanjingensis]MBB6671916.1 HPr family phosphocarrier protein [Cohnella nanjingensis]